MWAEIAAAVVSAVRSTVAQPRGAVRTSVAIAGSGSVPRPDGMCET